MTRYIFWLILMLVVAVLVGLVPDKVLALDNVAVAVDGEGDVIEPESMALLMAMARTVAEAKELSVTVRSRYDAPQENGQMIEFGASHKIQIKRPDGLRVEIQRSDGEQQLLLFDGQQIVVQNVSENVYSKVAFKGSLDDAIKYLVRDLGAPLPLARLFRTAFPADMERMVEGIAYVERDILTAVPTDQLAARTRDVDFQTWTTQGDAPLLLRIVMTYKQSPGKPQFSGDFLDWNLSAKAAVGPFSFTPPKDAEEIPILVFLRDDAERPGRAGGVR